MEIIHTVHSYMAYVVLLVLFIAVANAIIGYSGDKLFTLEKDFRICLFALILAHLQLLLGLILYFISPNGLGAIQSAGIGELNPLGRLLALEHPLTNIIAITLITIGWSRHKKILEARKKFKTISIFYGLGLILILWSLWFT